jgi:putative DNA primase/helicase
VAFVLPHETIGDDAERIVFQSESQMENTFRVKHDAAAWRDRIGALCVGNSRLVFAVACAFAGPLLRPAGMESGGFHIPGRQQLRQNHGPAPGCQRVRWPQLHAALAHHRQRA